jgi:phage shock protein A
MAGYEGILGKVKLLLTANVQDLLNKALNTNKPAVFDEQINMMQGSLETITVALGEAIGREKTLTREIAELKDKLEDIDAEIDKLLDLETRETDANRLASIKTLAVNRQATYNSTQDVLELKETQLKEIGEQKASLQDARVKLAARIETLRAQKTRLLALISERKAAEAQGKALSTADLMSRFSPDELIRDEEAAVERARGIVSARASTVESQIDDLLGNEALEQQLAERRAKRNLAPQA